MLFSIRLDPLALEDLRETLAFIEGASGERAAERWREGLVSLVDSLDTMPHRFGTVSDLMPSGGEYRQAVYHSHRIIYRVVAEVQILRVYHSRRDRLGPDDLPPATPPGA